MNAATCHLMDVLEMREAEGWESEATELMGFGDVGDGTKTSRLYGAAFTSAIRALAEDVDVHGTSQLSSGGIHWSPFLVSYHRA